MNMRVLFYLFIFLSPFDALGSNIVADMIAVSTIAGQTSSNGITFESSVYVTEGSSLTLQGPGGYIISASSISASSFFGSGAQLNQVGVLFATQTFSGASSFVSSFTIQSGGREITLSTTSSASNISINTKGAILFFPELHNSSSTIVPDTESSNNSFGPCVEGSTITITTNGGRVELNFTGSIYGSAPADTVCGLSFLQDGQFGDGLSGTVGVTSFELGTNGFAVGTPFSYMLSAPASGTHNYCLSIARLGGGGTCTLINSLGRSPLGSGSARNLFYAKEIK